MIYIFHTLEIYLQKKVTHICKLAVNVTQTKFNSNLEHLKNTMYS